jgi:ABC-type multidrug transport system fused ATPase/permease subunit
VTTPHFLDQFSLAQLFLVTLTVMVLFIEIGFRIGLHSQSKAAKAQSSQVRSIMGAVLGLLAFILAFSFATGQSHYEARVQYMVEEARLARNAYFQAEFLPAPYAGEARQILHRYIGDRIRADQLAREDKVAEILELIEQSEQMHEDLWRIAAINEKLPDESPSAGLGRDPFTELVSGLIDIHAQRLQAALMNRIPHIIWITLYLCALLSMLVMGYQAGLVGRRSPIATVSLALAFSGIMMLITDLDRPMMSLFHMDNHIMVEVMQMMDEEQAELLKVDAGA